MNLHEYQSKEIFARYGLPVSKGVVIKSLQEVSGAFETGKPLSLIHI